MALTAADNARLERALELARAAAGLAAPNPAVGCVLVDADGRVLGEGAHVYAQRDHAEVVALKQAAALGNDVRGATAYVTLEPCSHQGRTGPCADALVAAGIARCVVGTVDPNPLVSGNGLAKLRAAGVVVEVADGEIAWAARRLNDAFACWIQRRRPFVTLKAAVSVDGMIAPPAKARAEFAPHWITGSAARLDVQALRFGAQAIVTGIGTVLADDPLLTDRTGLPREALLRVVLDGGLRIPLASKLVRSAKGDVLVVCSRAASVEREAALRAAGVDVLRVDGEGGRLELVEVLKVLGERGKISVLVEAGSAVNGAFLRADLVDRVVLYYAECELGLEAVPFAAGFASPYAVQAGLTGVERVAFASDVMVGAEDVRVSGYVRDPWFVVRGSWFVVRG
jgi:diaminohydroxyphosphoribosylaminopyrimidine deaminase/5-amino-6-(5-phosphoribosylamino)uracil reductase